MTEASSLTWSFSDYPFGLQVVPNLRFGGTGVGARRVQIPSEEVLGALGIIRPGKRAFGSMRKD